MFKKPLVSICIPVYKTENSLESCVKSALAQDFKKMEIIVVDDGSYLENPQKTAEQIIKQLKKHSSIHVKLVKHSRNLGLVEARRTAVYTAKGQYIFNLDSDDSIPPNAIKSLYSVAEEKNADIVQGIAKIVGAPSPEILEKKEKLTNIHHECEIINTNKENQILNAFLIEKNISGYLWGKLIRRDVYLEAFSRIPPITCTFAEDLIQSLWIFNFAKSFIGTENIIYNYSMDSGISSQTLITELSRWEKVCSTSGVFTAIITECNENGNPFTEDQMNSIREICKYYVRNNLLQLEKSVASEIKEQAYEMLCDYWGKDLVETIKSQTTI